MKKVLVSMSAFALLFSACAHKIVVSQADTVVSKNELVAFDVDWVKDKTKKFDIQLFVTNTSHSDFIILLDDMDCFRGTTQGVLSHTFFNSGKKTIPFKPGQRRQFRLVCDLDQPAQGDYRIVINRVFDNQEIDGKTKDKVLGEKIELKIPSKT